MLVPALPHRLPVPSVPRPHLCLQGGGVSLARHVFRHRCSRWSQETVLREQCGPRGEEAAVTAAGHYLGGGGGLVLTIQVLSPG